MASPVTAVLESAMYTGSSPKGFYWAFRHPNPDAPPQTYRLTRRSGNGWLLLLAASRETKAILSFYAETPEDQQAVKDALRWLGIPATLQAGDDGIVLRLADGAVVRSQMAGGEKPTKKK